MNTISTISLGSICEGCLSVDRKLTPIYGEESKGFYRVLESVDQVNPTIQLCWECSAVLRKLLRFREQVKSARDCLVGYMLHQATMTSLSQLRITKNGITEHISYETYETKNPNRDSKTDIKELQIDAKKERRRCNIQSEESKSTSEPVAFVKIEERDDCDDEFDDAFAAEAVGGEDVKTVMKHEVPAKRKRRKKMKEYSFDESDDEPLKKKAEEKSKMEKVKPPVVKRRTPREKPAGVVSNARVDRKLRQLNVSSTQLEMLLLTWEQIEEERVKALSSEAFTRHEYRCYDCVLGFNHRAKLADHMRKHDPATGTISCSLCKVRCKDAHALGAHRRRHRVRWRCRECGSTFSRAAVAADHLARAHRAAHARHACARCGHVAATLGKLRNHLKDHSERQNCELCGKSFRDRSSLRTHLFIHRGEKEYACPQCDKKFLFKKALEIHLVTHEAPELLYCHQVHVLHTVSLSLDAPATRDFDTTNLVQSCPCEACDMNFKNRMSFYQHMKYNLKHIDPAKLKHVCTLCGKRFAKSSRLSEHNLAVHLKHTPISCVQPDCTFACASRAALRTHVRVAHRGAGAVRNHVCHSCGKAYTTKKTLEGHLRSHTGARPLRCARCPAAFGYDAALYNHTRRVHLQQTV